MRLNGPSSTLHALNTPSAARPGGGGGVQDVGEARWDEPIEQGRGSNPGRPSAV